MIVHFEIGGARHRVVLKEDVCAIERFDGMDALDVERWRPADLERVNAYGCLVARPDEWVAAVVKAIAAGQVASC